MKPTLYFTQAEYDARIAKTRAAIQQRQSHWLSHRFVN